MLMAVTPAWGQSESPAIVPTPAASMPDDEDVNLGTGARMLAPPPVSGQSYPTEFSGEERSNYLRGGVIFTTGYSDNVLQADGKPISSASYLVAPNIALNDTTSRTQLVLSYAPGFTVYQDASSLNQFSQAAQFRLAYRLSPHVTVSVQDSLLQTSGILNQPGVPSLGAVSGGAQGPNFTVFAPTANQITNAGSVGITYQFSANSMVGASGTFSNLHFLSTSQSAGLFDSSSQGGSGFYARRIAKRHYVGVAYAYQRLVADAGIGTNETQTNAILGFYTIYPTSKLSVSFFGGPQHSNTVQPMPFPTLHSWKPAAGTSLDWVAGHTNFALSYAHSIAGGSGLEGAVTLDSATMSVRQQITKMLNATVNGGYAQNNVVGSLPGAQNGHTVFATVAAQQYFGRERQFSLQLGYTRLHETYSNVPVIAIAPNTNREFVALSYQFEHAIGR